jgi:hypothetical protein
LLGLGGLVKQLSRTTTGTARLYAASKLQLEVQLLPAAVYLVLAAFAIGAVALAIRRAARTTPTAVR